jgi:hypothetical protein
MPGQSHMYLPEHVQVHEIMHIHYVHTYLFARWRPHSHTHAYVWIGGQQGSCLHTRPLCAWLTKLVQDAPVKAATTIWHGAFNCLTVSRAASWQPLRPNAWRCTASTCVHCWTCEDLSKRHLRHEYRLTSSHHLYLRVCLHVAAANRSNATAVCTGILPVA